MLTVMTYNVGVQELAPEQGAAIAAQLGDDYPYTVLLTDFNRVGWQAAYRQLRQSGLMGDGVSGDG